MPIEWTCTTCGKHLRVADEHAGKQARCPGCQNIYTVPGSGSTYPTNLAETQAWESQRSPSADFDVWFLQIDSGQVYGPVPLPELRQWHQEGRVSDQCRVRRQGEADWEPATALFPDLLKQSPQNRHPQQPYTGHSPQPAWGSTARPLAAPGTHRPGTPQRMLEPHRGGLLIFLGILSVVCIQIVGPIAWFLANQDLKKMEDGTMDPEGMGQTRAGQVLGIVGTVLLAVGILAQIVRIMN